MTNKKSSLKKKKLASEHLSRFIKRYFASKADFARTMGVARQTVNGWTKGRTLINDKSIAKLITLFDDDLPLDKIRPDLVD